MGKLSEELLKQQEEISAISGEDINRVSEQTSDMSFEELEAFRANAISEREEKEKLIREILDLSEIKEDSQEYFEAFEEYLPNTVEELEEIRDKTYEDEELDPAKLLSRKEIKKLVQDRRTGNFWWLNALDRFDIDSVPDNTRTYYRAKGEQGKFLSNAKQLKTGDLLIGYQAKPVNRIKAIFVLDTEAKEDANFIEIRLLYRFVEQTTYRELKELPIFSSSGLARYLQGSFKKLDYELFEEILNSTELKPIALEDKADETDKIPFSLDNVENTDRLNREPIANSLAGLINNDIFNRKNKTNYAFMVHLQGEWGEGKSTFLNLLKNKLTADKNKWIVTDFNAWRNQHIEPPWWSFLDAVYKDSIRELPWYLKPYLYATEGMRRVLGFDKLPKLITFIITIALISLLVTFQDTNLEFIKQLVQGNTTNTQLKSIDSILKIFLSLAALIGIFFSFSKFISYPFFINSPSKAKSFMQHAEDPMKLVKNHFSNIVRDLKFLGYHMAVFIDDIDRCNASFTVLLLEGIQTLFKDKAVLYVVAGDKQWITTCFENNYEKYQQVVDAPGQRLGYLFLEKAFQLSIRLPKVSKENIQEYWDYILNPGKETSKNEHEDKKEEFLTGISSNPC